MGWRTDQAYEDAQKADRKAWKASLTWTEYFGVLLRSYGSVLAGSAVGLMIVTIAWMVFR
jgi:hypothetical protein